MAITADLRDYRDSFRKHRHAYLNWANIGSDNSKRLILVYCVESGLKCLLMQKERIQKVTDAQENIAHQLYSHDLNKLLMSLNLAGIYYFPQICTVHGDIVRSDTYHQLCRYCVRPLDNHRENIEQYDNQLRDIAEWISERV